MDYMGAEAVATLPSVEGVLKPVCGESRQNKPLDILRFQGLFVVPYFFIIPNSASSSSALAIALR
ncbi:hypothetical protein GLGCALEP_05022 [Pseudomonas sp. MM221]|nr:hypothetical protein DBADOPDK_04900 [Pseudomonas sp. MM223]CAI3808497.1 hypothetical protein GLGCALEP_05022 [Pseudomonas sp. MM221]